MKSLALGLVVVVAGCSSKNQQETPPAQPPAPTAPDPACVDQTTKLADWLKALAAAGPLPFTGISAHLARLDGAAATAMPDLPVVTLTADTVVFQGAVLVDRATKPGAAATRIADAVAEARATGIVFVIDDKTPWSSVVQAVTAASGEVKGPITFAFEAGAAAAVMPPPKSAIGSELDAIDKFDPAAKARPLTPDGKPTLVDRVFAGCPNIARDVLPKLGDAATAAAKDAIITGDLPKAIAACGCKVEIASVQRLVWAWYGRDTGIATTTVSLHIGKPGTKLTARPTAPWSETAKLVADAAKRATPVYLQ